MVRPPPSRETAIIQRVPVHASSFFDSSPARSGRGMLGERDLDLAGLEADEADDALQSMLELQLAMLAGERHDIGEGIEPGGRRGARRRLRPGGGRGTGNGAGGAEAGTAAIAGDDEEAGAGPDSRCGTAVAAERAQRLVGGRQVGGVGEADDDHVGGGKRARRLRASRRCP